MCKMSRSAVCALTGACCLLAGALLGATLHAGFGPQRTTRAHDDPAAERVEYYASMRLLYGWKPSGVQRISEEEMHRRPVLGYEFVYHGDELYGVFVADTGRHEVVLGRAFVLYPDYSPYGADPFIITPETDRPERGRNFTAFDGELCYLADFDRKGRLTRYTVVRDRPGWRDETRFRCTYNAQGLPTGLKVVGENGIKDRLPFASKLWYYDEKGYLAVEVIQGYDVTTATFYDRYADGTPTNSGYLAKREKDGSYRILRVPGKAGDGQEEEWVTSDKLPEVFHRYTKRLPMPANGG